jgi:hypothetical protein
MVPETEKEVRFGLKTVHKHTQLRNFEHMNFPE